MKVKTGYIEKITDEDVSNTTDITEPKWQYSLSEYFGTRSSIVCRIMEIDKATGARSALRFLENDPPIFFRQAIMNKLNDTLSKIFSFDIAQPFNSEINQKAARKVRIEFGLEVIKGVIR